MISTPFHTSFDSWNRPFMSSSIHANPLFTYNALEHPGSRVTANCDIPQGIGLTYPNTNRSDDSVKVYIYLISIESAHSIYLSLLL